MAHRKREAFIDDLLARLGIDGDRVVWDRHNDRWDTGRRAMAHHDPDATHHLVVQDDALVPPDLIAGLTEALDHVPAGAAMCLYAGKTARFWNGLANLGVTVPADCWMVLPQIHWGVGIVMPTELIAPMLTWCDRRTEVANYDKRMSRWCEARGIEVWYPMPSLVEHRQSPSLVAGRGHRGRRAQRFIGDTSVAGLDWDRPVVRVPPLSPTSPRRPHGRGHLPSTLARPSGHPPARPATVRPVRGVRRRRGDPGT